MKAKKENTKSRKEIYGEHHGDGAASYNNLGAVYIDLGLYNQVKECYGKSLAIGRDIYGEEHRDVKRIFTNLRLVEIKQRKDNETRNKCCIL